MFLKISIAVSSQSYAFPRISIVAKVMFLHKMKLCEESALQVGNVKS